MKIKTLSICSFRGVTKELTLNFFDKNNRPCSAIIFGDNGTGKSSIIDSVEFLLQNRIDRTHTLLNKFRPSVLNLNKSLPSKIKCTFEDNTEFIRNIIPIYSDKDKNYHPTRDNNEIKPSFKLSPIVLRRNDIIKYLQLPTQSKQLIFWSFLYDLKLSKEETLKVDSAESQKLIDTRLHLKKYKRQLLAELADKLNIDVKLIPITQTSFNDFVSKYITKGIKLKTLEINNQIKNKGIRYDLIPLLREILKTNIEIAKNNKEVKNINKKIIYEDFADDKKTELLKFLENSSNYLTSSFREISKLDYIEKIVLKGGKLTDISFEIDVHLTNGIIVPPTAIFSEANLDLLILLLYTSIIKEASNSGQAKIIILDDVLQSVDSTIRLNYIDYLLKHFIDWQIIITAHDRLWLNQMKTIFQRHSHNFKEFEIRSWDFNFGPKLFEINSTSSQLIDYNKLLEDPPLLAAKIGLTLEFVCNQLSVELSTSIQRKKDDKYTLGDLWPGIFKVLKKTNIVDVVESIDKLIHIRNILGAHYNEWAISLSDKELIDFAVNTNTLLSAVFCNDCFTWINIEGSCRCKKINVKKSTI